MSTIAQSRYQVYPTTHRLIAFLESYVVLRCCSLFTFCHEYIIEVDMWQRQSSDMQTTHINNGAYGDVYEVSLYLLLKVDLPLDGI